MSINIWDRIISTLFSTCSRGNTHYFFAKSIFQSTRWILNWKRQLHHVYYKCYKKVLYHLQLTVDVQQPYTRLLDISAWSKSYKLFQSKTLSLLKASLSTIFHKHIWKWNPVQTVKKKVQYRGKGSMKEQKNYSYNTDGSKVFNLLLFYFTFLKMYFTDFNIQRSNF